MEIVTLLDQLNKTSLVETNAISWLLGGSDTVLSLIEKRRIFLEKSDNSDDYEAWVVFRDDDFQFRAAPILEFILHLNESDSIVMDDHQIALFVDAGGRINQLYTI
jgi:hypothetical protein